MMWIVCCVPVAFLFGVWTGLCIGTGREPWSGKRIVR